MPLNTFCAILALSGAFFLFQNFSSPTSAAEFSSGKVFHLKRVREEFPKSVSSSYECPLLNLKDPEEALRMVTTDYMRTALNGELVAACAVKWLNHVVKTTPPSAVGDPQKRVSLLLHFAVVAEDPSLDPRQIAKLKSWFLSLKAEDGDSPYLTLYWITAGFVFRDQALQGLGTQMLKNAVQRIREDGSIAGLSPEEQSEILGPLFVGADILHNNGISLFHHKSVIGGGSLIGAARFILSLEKPLPLARAHVEWLEIYHRHFFREDNRAGVLLSQARAAPRADAEKQARLGPQATLAWGVRSL